MSPTVGNRASHDQIPDWHQEITQISGRDFAAMMELAQNDPGVYPVGLGKSHNLFTSVEWPGPDDECVELVLRDEKTCRFAVRSSLELIQTTAFAVKVRVDVIAIPVADVNEFVRQRVPEVVNPIKP